MPFARYLAAIALALSLASLPTAAQAITDGVDYATLPVVQPTNSKGKVEVIEFFAYTCPHCFHFEPMLNAWAKKLPGYVVLKREPVIFNDSWEPMARAYFALKDMGALDRLHDAVFKAIHVENQNLMVPDVFFDWGAKQGLDRAKLKATYYSFSVSADISRAKAMQRAYQIRGVPTLAINGKYTTSASMVHVPGMSEADSFKRTLVVTDLLIEKERKTTVK